MDGFVRIEAHAARVREGLEQTLGRVLAPPLATTPHARPVVVIAVDDLATLTAGVMRSIRDSGRRVGGSEGPRVGVRVPGGGRVQIPSNWIGGTMVLLTRIPPEGEGASHALARLAWGVGARAADAPRVGGWLATHAFAAVVVVLHGAGHLAVVALPRRPRAAAAVDAWLARRLGHARPMPAGFSVRSLGDRGPWASAPRRFRLLSLAGKPREKR